MTTASIPPEKLLMYGALAIAGYWFVSRKSNAGAGMGTSYRPGASTARPGASAQPPYARTAGPGMAAQDSNLWGAAVGLLGGLMGKQQTTIYSNPGGYTQDGTDGNAPNVYGREQVRNIEKGGDYYGGSPGDSYRNDSAYSGPVGSRMGGYSDYSSTNDATVINPAPAYGSVYDAANYDGQVW